MAALDLIKVECPKKNPMYSFLSFGWGLMSDIDIESEKLRSIGEIRFTVWALWRIASKCLIADYSINIFTLSLQLFIKSFCGKIFH